VIRPLLLVLLAASAWAHPTVQSPLVRVMDDGAMCATVPTIDLGANLSCSYDSVNKKAVITAAAGGGGGAVPAYVGISACGPIDGTVTVYIGEGTCADQAQSRSQVRVKTAMTVANLACWLGDGTTGARTVTIRAQAGVCGGVLADTAFLCTIGPGASACDTGVLSQIFGAGECHTFKVESDGALPGLRSLHCTLERTG
jgi:hypothetical protein